MGYIKLLFFMLFSFICQLAFSSHLCPKDEALALLQFNHMFTVAPGYCATSNPKTLSWNKNTDCCSWDGVYCDEMTGQVTELNLTCSGLQGKSITLGKLKSITLGNNNLDGQLEFLSFNGSWTQLELLDFSSNSLTGPIPSNVSGLQNLQSLHLSSNNLNGTIPSWIFSLPSLTE